MAIKNSSILSIALLCLVASYAFAVDLSSQAEVDHDTLISYIMENTNEEGDFNPEENQEDTFEGLLSSVKNMAYHFFNGNGDAKHTAHLDGKGGTDFTLSLKVDNKSVADVSFSGKGEDVLDVGVARNGNEHVAWAHGGRNATATIKTKNGTVSVTVENRFHGRIAVRRLGGKEQSKALKDFSKEDRRGNNIRVYRVTLEGWSGQEATSGNTTAHQHKSGRSSGHVVAVKGRPTKVSSRFSSEKRHRVNHGGKEYSQVASSRGHLFTVVRHSSS